MMITRILDYTLQKAYLVFCIAFVAISVVSIVRAEPPAPREPAAAPMPAKAKKKATRITAETSDYDSERNLVVFEGNVVMENPQMRLKCDVLEIQLNDGAKGPAAAAAGGIKSGVATGYVEIVTENAEGGEVVAHARRADFDALSQIVMLSDFPQLQDGKQLVKGTTPESRIFLNADGKHRTKGPTEITIIGGANTIPNLPK